jgi:transposase
MSYALWTRQAVSELIEARFAIRLTVRNTGKYLKRWRFTPQKPLKKAYEQSYGNERTYKGQACSPGPSRGGWNYRRAARSRAP